MTARNTRTTRHKPRVPTKEELAQYEAMRATAKAAMRRAESINAALADLFKVAERNVNCGLGDRDLRAAVDAVTEARRS
ncbi:hypothetical protein ACFS27_13595 [Promicromonospora vindobonensis]|uniref:Uncharacterized protein n=1 Tax=Promicromonospora vindobonensis TaxID=195748 RepID=A0ABW5VVL7_9MICO